MLLQLRFRMLGNADTREAARWHELVREFERACNPDIMHAWCARLKAEAVGLASEQHAMTTGTGSVGCTDEHSGRRLVNITRLEPADAGELVFRAQNALTGSCVWTPRGARRFGRALCDVLEEEYGNRNGYKVVSMLLVVEDEIESDTSVDESASDFSEDFASVVLNQVLF